MIFANIILRFSTLVQLQLVLVHSVLGSSFFSWSNMGHWFSSSLTFLGGLGVGAVYFGGLWLTIHNLPKDKRAIGVLVGSFLGRLVLWGGMAWEVIGPHWERLPGFLLGFLTMRLILVRHWGLQSSRAAV